jgi:hypothetical protein
MQKARILEDEVVRRKQNPLFSQEPHNTEQLAQNVASKMAFKPVPNAPKGYNTLENTADLTRVTQKETVKAVVRLKIGKTEQTLMPDLLECWDEAVGHYEQYKTDLGKCYRVAVALRALALYQNSKVRVRTATLPLFVPVVWVAYWLGVSEKYIWDMLKGRLAGGALLARLVGYRAWCTSWDGRDGKAQTRRGGCVFTVRCTPCEEGRGVSIHREAFTPVYRDLSADIAKGYTFGQMVKDTDEDEEKIERGISSASKTPRNKATEKLKTFLHSTLPQLYNKKTSVKTDTELNSDDDIYTVIHALNEPLPRGHNRRGEWVEIIANSICHVLNDKHSAGGWQKALWVVVKSRVHGLEGASDILGGALFEAVVRSSDNPMIRNRAALARSIMTNNGWADLEEAVSAFYAGREVVA